MSYPVPDLGRDAAPGTIRPWLRSQAIWSRAFGAWLSTGPTFPGKGWRVHSFADDLKIMARLGWGPDHLDHLARSGLAVGDLARLDRLPEPARGLVFEMIDDPAIGGFRDPDQDEG